MNNADGSKQLVHIFTYLLIAAYLLHGIPFVYAQRKFTEPTVKRRRVIEAEKLDYKTQTGAYVAEGKRIRRLILNRAKIKTHKKRKIASLFLLGLNEKKTVILPGPTAQLSIQATQPTFYVNAPDAAEWQFTLIRLTPKERHRKISEVFLSSIRRDVEKKSDPVAAHVRGLSPRLYEIRPIGPLSPGEYALARLPRINPLDTRRVAVESEVWDFRVEAKSR